MKNIIILFLSFLSALSYADGSADLRRFLKVSNAVKIDIYKIKKLPEDKGIIEVLQGYYSSLKFKFKDFTYLPPKFYFGYKLDLNKDGRNEYFINIPCYSGTGGHYYIIISFINNKWKIIGNSQGAFSLLKIKNGWHPIIFIGRGGNELYAKILYEFSNGKYHKKWIRIFDHGKITKKTIKTKPNSGLKSSRDQVPQTGQ
jgi:hypothetical protein